ncbi:MAG: S41 family peptidase [Candidatus Saccharibacteria bacterium]|nr:S41 family peptidase [Candidatus Saccharibacteria bacterium]
MRQIFKSKSRRFYLFLILLITLISLLGYSLYRGISYLRSIPANNPQNSQLPLDLDYKAVEEIYDHLRSSYDGKLTEAEILDYLKKGLVEATGDEHSEYLTFHEADFFNKQLKGQLIGVGIVIYEVNQQVVIKNPLKDTPAWRGDLRSGDIIIKVDGIEIVDQSLHQVTELITGELGTTVVLTISRPQPNVEAEILEISLKRELITAPSVEHEIKDQIGILTISRFTSADANSLATEQLAYQAAEIFQNAQVRGIVLDLRYNIGGEVNSAVATAGAWLQPNTLVTRLGHNQTFTDFQISQQAPQPPLSNIPLVILVNQATASAAEILAGSLEHYGVGQVIGQTTFGKTSAQSLIELDQGEGILKLTTDHWFTPDTIKLTGGLKPSVIVSDNPQTSNTDEALDKALEILKNNN